MPDGLYERVKVTLAKKKVTFKTWVIEALEKSLSDNKVNKNFRLRDGSVGPKTPNDQRVVHSDISRALDEDLQGSFNK